MPEITIKDLLEAGVHFGHQTKRWEPKMKPYIYGEKKGIFIIDLQQSFKKIIEVQKNISELIINGGSILFVGTKKQAQEAIQEEANRCNAFYVNQKWTGGLLTNFEVIKKNIDRLNKLEKLQESENWESLSKREKNTLTKEKEKLSKSLGGVKTMEKIPNAIFVVDIRKEQSAIKEAKKLKIPIIALVDTNCNPTGIDYIIPGNDDSIQSIKLITSIISNTIIETKKASSEGGEIQKEKTEAPYEEKKE